MSTPASTRGNGSASRDADQQRKRARTLAKQQQAAERIAAATAEISAGINEAASAAEELKRASDQIASGASEASNAAQESLVACRQMTDSITRQLRASEVGQTKMESTQALVQRTSADVGVLIANVGVAAVRQQASVELIAELEKQAANIGDIVKAVGRIADQTNLLALNAAIEAARAGKHGKGFAVVADEVRTLAETSEKSAKQIADLVGQIQVDVKAITSGINTSADSIKGEIEKGKMITAQLDQIRTDAIDVITGIREIAAGAVQSNAAALQALKGSEEIAAAAEEQSAAAEESAKSVQEQSQALAECEQTAQALTELAEDLKNSTDIAKSSEEMASSSEELSSAIQEINRSASQVMTALDEIRRGAQTSASATAESAAAMGQIERGLDIAQNRATDSVDRLTSMKSLLGANKTSVDQLIEGIQGSATATRTSINQVKDLAVVSRRIDKIVEAIATVSVQTNMLAVNGSIEAARAGEFGKGFAVVATDIRNLARDSAENADRIKDLVKSVQDQIQAVSRDLDEIVEAALDEVEKAKTTTANLVSIEVEVADVQNGASEILASANEIAAAVAQTKRGIDQISAASQQAERAAEEASTAARQQSQGAEELVKAVEEIASLADELQTAA
ncbi:methyl-accepting chemotaxis protein [Rhizobium sp. G21]|uniref:methyl-accepting chemotaxis protein n=1 Tax=Rhizobium sp. G21 TaxID=2758439 RepID=UPI001FEE0AB5|nr:methyl-accepting chemotaxis protein [Rhizobium sp. G21]